MIINRPNMNEVPDGNYLDYILKKRGVEDPETFRSLSMLSEHSLDPNLLKNIEEASSLLKTVLEDKGRTLFIVDSDNDGYTSSAILWNYIKMMEPDADLAYFLHEGKQHGLEDMVDRILDLEDEDIPQLVILPDGGTNDGKYHEQLVDNGISVLVLDHHQFGDGYYPVEGVIIVNNQDGDYPNPSLSGAGVVLKFCQYLDKNWGLDYSKYFYDLAAVGIIGDMMDLRDLETQYIVRKGLSSIHNPGLVEMVKARAYSIFGSSNMTDSNLSLLTPINVAFYLVPLVNALIRMGGEREKDLLFQALINGKEKIKSTKRGAKDMESIAQQSARNCVNAHSRQRSSREKALEKLEVQIIENDLVNDKLIFLSADGLDIDNNLTGLVAMQVLSKYSRPVIVARKNSDGYYRGSSRGVGGSSLPSVRNFMLESGLFEYVEGHDNANGISIHASKVEDFIRYSNENLSEVDFDSVAYDPDFVFEDSKLSGLRAAAYELGQIESKKMFGKGVEEPLFYANIQDVCYDDFQFMKSNTVKITAGGVSFIKFWGAELTEKIESMQSRFDFQVIGKASINTWNGVSEPQIVIEDYDIIDNRLKF